MVAVAAEGEVAGEEAADESADGDRYGNEVGASLSVLLLSLAAAVRRCLGEAVRLPGGAGRLRRVEACSKHGVWRVRERVCVVMLLCG